MTLANLVDFVLTNAKPRVRWLATFHLCGKPCLAKNLISTAMHKVTLFRRRKAHRHTIYELCNALNQQSLQEKRRNQIRLHLLATRRVVREQTQKLQLLHRLEIVFRSHHKRFEDAFEVNDELIKLLNKVQEESKPKPRKDSRKALGKQTADSAKTSTRSQDTKPAAVKAKAKEDLPGPIVKKLKTGTKAKVEL